MKATLNKKMVMTVVSTISFLMLFGINIMSAEASTSYYSGEGRSSWWLGSVGAGTAKYHITGYTKYNSNNLYEHENAIIVSMPDYPYSVHIGSSLSYNSNNGGGVIAEGEWGGHYGEYLIDGSDFLDGGGSNKSITRGSGTVTREHASTAIISNENGMGTGTTDSTVDTFN